MLRPDLQGKSTWTYLVAELPYGVGFCFLEPDQKSLHLRVELDPRLREQASDLEIVWKAWI